MPAFILLLYLLRVVSVLSDVQCDCNSLTFIKHLLQQEMFERKLENARIWSELKKISTGGGLIEPDSLKGSDISKRVDRLEEQSVPLEETDKSSHDQPETFQTIVQKAFIDEKTERINFFSQVLSQIDQFHENISEFKTATDKKINNKTRKWQQDHELFEQWISLQFSDFNNSIAINQQENVQKIADSFETVKDDMEQIKNITAEFKTDTNKKINEQATKWSHDLKLFEQRILQKFSEFNKSIEINQQKSDQQMANSFESVKNDMEQLSKDIAKKEEDIKDHVTVDLGKVKEEIQTDLDKCIESATEAKSSVVEYLNTVAALKSDVKDIETSVKGSTDTDLKDKFEKHVDDATKQFYSAAKKIGTCRGMKGNETQWKEKWKLHESKCFRFFETRKSWLGASESCKEHNADLVTIESKEETDFITSNIDLTRVRMWIGLNDRDNENVWKWQSTNNTLQSGHFSNWNQNEPNNKVGNEDCVEMYENGVWNDLKCNAARWFACEKDPEL